MSKPKVSIIIPIHNAGIYLKNLLENLINQTLKDIEIILVLDCPTDGSDSTAEEYAAKDNRIIIVRNTENLHVGFSRNEGLKIATGEYIGFCDHDDMVTTDMFEKLYNKGIETKAEVVISDYWIANKNKKWCNGIPYNIPSSQFIPQQFSALVNFRVPKPNKRQFDNNSVIWNCIFRRDFLSKYHITFPDNRITTFEDRIFLQKVYTHVQKISVIPQAFYTHIWHSNNTGASYHYRSLSHITTYLTGLYHFLQCINRLQTEMSNYTSAVLLFLYTSFRHELRHRSLLYTLRQLLPLRHNNIIQYSLRKTLPQLRHYPLTKIIFFFMIFNPFRHSPD